MIKMAATNTLTRAHALRCIHCGWVQEHAGSLFRCSQCNELLEVFYPEWTSLKGSAAQHLKENWRERRLSTAPQDASGVWRYRELLPQVALKHMVTLGEGNTPLLPLQHPARELRLPHLFAKHLGM